MLAKSLKFFKNYYKFSFTVIAAVLSAILALAGQSRIGNIILTIAAAIVIIPLLWGMIQDIRIGTYGVDILAATAIVTAILLGEYWAGIIIVLMLTGGESLEDYAEARANTELTSLLKQAPRMAYVMRGRKVVKIAASKVVVGNKLLIKPGEIVPVDGVIIEGSSSFDESSLTGESLPVERNEGDGLLSGSINSDSRVVIRATQTAEDSQYQQIIKLVKSAQSSQAPFVRLADRYSIPFTILSFVIAGSVWVLSGDPVRFLQVLVVATPCPLILGAPIAIISGMSRAARTGIIVKNGTAIEQLAAVKTIGFDKTGTLTSGQPVVDTVRAIRSSTKEQVMTYAAGLEQNSHHSLAQAVVNKARNMGIKVPKVKHTRELAGHGLSGVVKGHKVLIGTERLMNDRSIQVPKQLIQSGRGRSISFVAVDNEIIGSITFEDMLRPNVAAMLSALKQRGIKHTLMVTGDNKQAAQAIAKKIGMDDIRANSLPADKIAAIESVSPKPVAFVGDGVNDAPVLAASDIGIALGARGSAAASESAGVVIMLDDIEKVSESLKIAQDTLRIARQSILIGIFISIGLMLVYSTGRFSATSGAIIQEFVDVTVIVYALRAHGPLRKPRLKPALP